MSRIREMAEPRSSQTDALDRSTWIVAGVVLLGAIMSILDTTVVNVAIDHLAVALPHDAADDPVGGDRLHARTRDRDPAMGLGRQSLRHQAPLHGLDRDVRARFVPVGPRLVLNDDHPVPRPPGTRRRHDHAGRHDDPDARGRASGSGV